MTDVADLLPDPETCPTDWARALRERQLEVLSCLMEEGLQVSRQIGAQITDAASAVDEALGAAEGLALAYARVTRAVRLAIVLQDKLIDGLLADDACPRPRPESAPVTERKDQVQRILTRVIERDGLGEKTQRQARERLDRDFCGDLLARPISELIDLIARDLGLKPDWGRLAAEGWAKVELSSAAPGWPLWPYRLEREGDAESADTPCDERQLE